MRDVCRDLDTLSVNNQTDAVTNGTLKMPKDYKLAQVKHGAIAPTKKGGETTLSGAKLETAIQIVYESIKIHTHPEGRELQDMCVRINQELTKKFHGIWNCIASEKPIISWVTVARGGYLNIQLHDLFFEIFRSP
uniref:Dynein light chain n=1 Tax=Panagrolaimus davidi TaxID=227884 RepID=A0A914Q6U3_9BILA